MTETETVRLFLRMYSLVFVDKVFAVSRDRTNGVGVAIATQGLGAPGVLSPAAVSQLLHDGVDVSLEYLRQLHREKSPVRCVRK